MHYYYFIKTPHKKTCKTFNTESLTFHKSLSSIHCWWPVVKAPCQWTQHCQVIKQATCSQVQVSPTDSVH